MTAPEIGVLLPVRIETRFVPPGVPGNADNQWRLRIRIIPDAVSITDHDPIPSQLELDAVEAMWQRAKSADLETAEGRQAWDGLVAAVGAERAAWLARTFKPTFANDATASIERPPGLRESARRSKLAGLPPEIQLWLGRGGAAPLQVAELTVLSDEIELDFADPDQQRDEWWTSFDEAVRVGLATEIMLGTDQPTNIDVLYAVGIGGGDPGPLLAAHAEGGRFGIMAPGLATTSVDGRPLAAIGGDADEWRTMVAIPAAAQSGTSAVLASVAGSTAVTQQLGAVPGGESDHRPLNQALVATLWPALWGHALGDVNGAADADRIGVWAVDNVVPEGPLPALRVGKQPYGILPVTTLRRWRFEPGDPAIERELVPVIDRLVADWARAAEGPASVRPPRSFDDLLATVNATAYSWRWMVPVEIAQGVSFRYGNRVAGGDIAEWWNGAGGGAPRLPSQQARPNRRLVAVGWGHELESRLVEDGPPERAPERLTELRDAAIEELLQRAVGSGQQQRKFDDSLLTELARHSIIASAAGVARTAARQPRAVVEQLSADDRSPTELESWALRFRAGDLGPEQSPATRVHRNVLAGLDTLAGQRRSDVERALRATLDTATHRIDPWATAIAWRRLQSLAAAPRSLGIYAWVDSPRPRTSSRDDEYVLAPSVAQATVAAVLRDRALRDPDADRWQMDLDSNSIRAAIEIADDIRDGGHPAEVLGRLVERIVGHPETVNALRQEFPLLASNRLIRYRRRRVCDGTRVLAATLDEPNRLTTTGVNADQLAELTEAAHAVDALGDLHVADATYGMVRGRSAATRAADAATAAVGMAPPLDVVRTERTGHNVVTIAVVLVPATLASTTNRPATIADPSITAYLDQQAGDPAGSDWTWTEAASENAPARSITLADAGLNPADTVGLGVDNLAQVIRDMTGAGLLEGVHPAGHSRLRNLATALSGAPALPEDVGDGSEVKTDVSTAELFERFQALRAAAIDSASRLSADAETSDENILRAALGNAARWSITPQAGIAEGDTVQTLNVRVQRAAEALSNRISVTPDADSAATLTAAELAEAIAELLAPEAAFPVSARLAAADLSSLVADTGATRIDPDWLETVAPVRPTLARLEAAQLALRIRGDTPLAAWSSRPDDIWQTQIEVDEDDIPLPSRLVVAFGPGDTLPAAANTEVAAILVDRFVEVIPNANHDSGAAFRHDLPDARAQQSILLAVPPVVDEEWSAQVLLDVVTETRRLTRARVADPDKVGASANTLHLAALSAAGRGAVRVGKE